MEKIADIRRREILESYYQVISKKGIEGSSIAKIAKLMGVQPSLITHYFKTKDEMTMGLVDFILEKYEEPYFYGISDAADYEKRFHLFLDGLFGLDRIRFVDAGAFYSCYCLTFRNPKIRERFGGMYDRFRTLLIKELTLYMNNGVIGKIDVTNTANAIMSLMEGLAYFERMLDAREYRNLCRSMKETVLRLVGR
ncbi:MAG: TetR family transcriptional regulator [Deltaproteobacteria bacterium]|nr:TetR family transcriptional regulator [Candidatus Zymogenaceae bacterium]